MLLPAVKIGSDQNKDIGLNSTYSVRNSTFFTVGTVFSIVFTEACGDSKENIFGNVFAVKFGETVYSQIMRFIVVQAGNGFCYACQIQTYSGRGTTKPGCNPREHAVVYMEGDEPTLCAGEKGLPKKAIKILSSSDIIHLDPASRIRFGRGQVIQHNMKAKEIGHVAVEDLPRLLAYWREEMTMGFGDIM
ncbi:hypothetical protein K469DRAFT_589696 [Zopfia rhizophila CBS 207.26]|uniref:DUF6590 domain-containing protein n=1 Tax=Zopfia rhizophila CBS 207.26 TaxID=1314779 RepID=A0A6A6DNV9_9PEZI|nr:hypothetical protein K469DRAFT_589696 [Zopfia rhizophila CBS 207.26]